MANSMGYHLVGPIAWATIHMGELVQENKEQFNCGSGSSEYILCLETEV